MTTCYEIGDKLKGYMILCEARQNKISKSNTKNWKTQSTTNSLKR